MKAITTISLFILSTQLVGQIDRLTGLWLVEKVKVGNEIMTPDAKWTRLNSDGTEESGNGGFRHSYGKWEYDEFTKELLITTKNGLDDPFGAFYVDLKKDKMIWSREEEGMNVVVTLSQIEKLPETYRDRLLGLWKLDESEGACDFFKEDYNDSDYLFIRWDGKFVVGVGDKKTYGVYNVHGHKPQIELIPYNDNNRSFWSVKFLENGFEMILLNSDNKVRRRFTRIRNFPN